MASVLRSETDRLDWLGTTVFVFDDPMAAIKMQCNYLKDHLRPLPIVGAYTGKLPTTQRGYIRRVAPVEVLRWHNRDFIFWGAKYTPELMNMAARAHGQVKVFVGEPPGSSRVTIPAAWLALVRRHAKSWEKALEDAVLTMPDGEWGQLITGLQIHDSRLRDALNEMSPEAKSKARCHPRCADVLRTAYFAPNPITEGPDGWYHKLSGKRITDAILRIERILCRDSDSKRYYEGHIVFRNEKVTFLASASEVERGPFAWMRKCLLANGYGEMKSVGYWSGCAVELAKQFRKPQIVINAGRIGWHGREGKFFLPAFAIGLGGKVIEEPMPTWDRLAPAANLHPPGNLDPHVLEELTADTLATRIFWAAAAAIAANIIARPRGYEVAGVVLVGEGASTIGAIAAEALGCREYQASLQPRSPIDYADGIQKVVDRHNWPIHLRFPDRTPPTHLRWWLACSDDRNAVVDIDPLLADAAGMFGRWRSIIFDGPVDNVDAIVEFGPHLLPALAQGPVQQKDPAGIVQAGRWPRKCSRTWPIGLAEMGATRMCSAMRPHSSMIWSKTVSILAGVWSGYSNGSSRAGIWRFSGSSSRRRFLKRRVTGQTGEAPVMGIFAPEGKLDEVFRSKDLPPPDPYIIAAPRRPDLPANVLQIEHEGQPGWIIEEGFWDKEIQRCRKADKRRRRIARALRRSRELNSVV